MTGFPDYPAPVREEGSPQTDDPTRPARASVLQKVRIDMDLTRSSLDVAVQQYVERYGHWPDAVISAAVADYDDVHSHASSLGLRWHVLPPTISIKIDAWALVGANGETIWSPGA